MDPTDARRIVIEVCRREGVALGPVLELGGLRSFARVRRVAILELRRRGASLAVIALTFGRHRATVQGIARRAVATHTAAPAR